MDTTNNPSSNQPWMTIQPFKNKPFKNFTKTLEEPAKMDVTPQSYHVDETSLPQFIFDNNNDDPCGEFKCYLCTKTFYNMNALNNHKKMQHDLDSDSDVYFPQYIKLTDFSINGLCGFKFVPLKHNDSNSIQNIKEKDGLVIRLFEQDTSYVIVKVEHTVGEIEAAKRQRLEGILKKTKLKPGKPPFDLRGPFTCTFPISKNPEMVCRQIFFNCCAFSLHYRDLHTKRRKAPARCQVCEKRLDTETYAANEEGIGDEIDKPEYACDICKKTFSNKLCYDQHKKLIHIKNKTHQCNICMKWFTQASGLQQHMRMHNGTRLHNCQYCSKPFAQKSGLEQHLRIHTKVKPFICIICSKSFSQSVHLRQHMRTHTNIQPFECMLCDRSFKQSSHLKFHLKSHREYRNSRSRGGLSIRSPQADKLDSKTNILSCTNLQTIIDYNNLYYNSNLPSTQGPEQYPQQPFDFQNAHPASMMMI